MNSFLASPFAAQPGALVVGLLLAWMIFRLGRGAFRARLFGVAMSMGAVMGTLILFQEAPFQVRANPHHFSAFTISFGLAGFPEEAAKMIGAFFFLRPYYLRRTSRDLVLAAASLALGFALLENVLYISAAGENWARLAVSRALTAVPFHVLLGLCGGYAIARAEAVGWGLAGAVRIAAAWIALSILHGAYDLPQFLLSASPRPDYVVTFAARLGLAQESALYLVTLTTLIVVGALAILDLRALERPPFAPFDPATALAPTRWSQIWLSRRVGGALAILLLVPALIALVGAAWFGFAFEQAANSLWIAIGLMCPISAAAIFLLFPSQPSPQPLSRAWSRGLLGGATAVAALALFALQHYGLEPARQAVASGIVEKGLASAAKGDFDEAIKQYERALAFDPNFTDALSRRAAAHEAQDRFDLALADLDEAILKKPDNPDYLYQRSEVHRERHETVAAFADIDRALALAPNSPILLAARAQVDLDARDVDKARADIAAAQSASPNEPSVWRVKAAVMLYLIDLDGALEALNASLEIKPDDPGALFTRGRVWFYKGEMTKAASDFERSAAGQPTFLYPDIWRFLARARMRDDGRVELAATASKTDEAKWPRPVAKLLLGQLTAAQTRAAAANDDQRCEADFYAGSLEIARGDAPTGRALLQKAADECPPEFIEWEGARAELVRLGSSPPARAETIVANGVTKASLRDRGHIHAGPARWSFAREDDGPGELRAELSFPDVWMRAQIVIGKKSSGGLTRYQIDVNLTPETNRPWAISALGDSLGAPVVRLSDGSADAPIAGPLERLEDAHYVGVIAADKIGETLAKLLGPGHMAINLDPATSPAMELDCTLDGESAKSIDAAKDAWN